MEEKRLKREIGVWGLSANIVNIVVGAGIFVLPAIVAARLGSASILAYLFCGFLITLIMLCFAEVGSKITETGGVYAFMEATFGKYLGFLTVVLFVLATIGADAAVANAIADILSSVFPVFQGKVARIAFFLVVFLGLGFINIIGVKEGVLFVKSITAIKMIPLFLIILAGLGVVQMDYLYWESLPTIKDLGEISLILFFAFQGAESGLSVSGEVRNPNRTIPRAILVSIFGILLLYILIQTVSQGVLGPSLANFQDSPLSEVARVAIGPVGFSLLTVSAAISMLGNLSSEVLSMPRVLYAASLDKVIPFPLLSKVHPKYATPYVAIIVYAGIGFIFASLGGFKQLAIIASASILLIYLGVAMATIKLRINQVQEESPSIFKIPGGYTVPILSALIIIWFLSNLSQTELLVLAMIVSLLSLLYLLKLFFQKK